MRPFGLDILRVYACKAALDVLPCIEPIFQFWYLQCRREFLPALSGQSLDIGKTPYVTGRELFASWTISKNYWANYEDLC